MSEVKLLMDENVFAGVSGEDYLIYNMFEDKLSFMSKDELYRNLNCGFKLKYRPDVDISLQLKRFITKLKLFGDTEFSVGDYHYKINDYDNSVVLYRIDNIELKSNIFIEPYVSYIDLNKFVKTRHKVKILGGSRKFTKFRGCPHVHVDSRFEDWSLFSY